jgi:hypothetical protein
MELTLEEKVHIFNKVTAHAVDCTLRLLAGEVNEHLSEFSIEELESVKDPAFQFTLERLKPYLTLPKTRQVIHSKDVVAAITRTIKSRSS